MPRSYVLPFFCVFCLLAASGCSKSTGVMPWSEDSYSVSADVDKTVFTKPSDAEQLAYSDASSFCASQGQGVAVESFQHVNSRWHYTVKLIFRCIPEGGTSPKGRTSKAGIEML